MDYQIYVKSLHQIHIHNPSLVLISDTFLSAALAAGERSASTSLYISEESPGVQIDTVGRRYWNDAGGKLSWTFLFPCFERFLGLEFALKLCVDDDEGARTVLTVSNK